MCACAVRGFLKQRPQLVRVGAGLPGHLLAPRVQDEGRHRRNVAHPRDIRALVNVHLNPKTPKHTQKRILQTRDNMQTCQLTCTISSAHPHTHIYTHLEERDVRIVHGQLVHLGGNHLARPTPLREKVDQRERLGLQLHPKLHRGGPRHHSLHHFESEGKMGTGKQAEQKTGIAKDYPQLQGASVQGCGPHATSLPLRSFVLALRR